MDAISKTKDRLSQLKTRTGIKLSLWFILSLAFSFVFFKDFWGSLPTMLSPSWILEQHHASPWAALALCLLFLWLKRKELWQKIAENKEFRIRNSRAGTELLLGIVLVVCAILMPSSEDYLVFQVLLASLGVFIALFRKAAKIPSILLAIYGFAISFPLAVEHFAEYAYSQTALVPVMGLMPILNYPFQNQQQWVYFTSTTGEPITVAITAACAGPATMGLFIALFALMMLDIPLPPKRAAGLFLFGVAGTWFQSFIRLIILLLLGYYLGKDALWIAHSWTIFILFPLWFILFACVYFRQVRRPPEARE